MSVWEVIDCMELVHVIFVCTRTKCFSWVLLITGSYSVWQCSRWCYRRSFNNNRTSAETWTAWLVKEVKVRMRTFPHTVSWTAKAPDYVVISWWQRRPCKHMAVIVTLTASDENWHLVKTANMRNLCCHSRHQEKALEHSDFVTSLMSYIIGVTFTQRHFVLELLRKAIGSRTSKEYIT
jgi:hypothetical protein